MPNSRIVVPGEALADTMAGPTLGAGVYSYAGRVFSTVVGRLDANDNTISVRGKTSAAAVPVIGSIVLGRVKRINSRMAVVAILVVGEAVVKEEFEAVIRVENVRATEIDKVKIPDCFRPGDIVRAEVISLGEQHSYILTTARNDLGVVMAQSQEGAMMRPVSWNEMQCTKTGAIEHRKTCMVTMEGESASV
ncbi:hypothetical protein BC828DRAFT_390051 [Blastocladiella britannica]|nr:hypothetical protein BC828DRAFT_390051 [Blastocladiella britannica]